MAKGDPLSRYQTRIVRNFYEHRDTASLHKLGEIISELYISKDDRKACDKLWSQAGKALERLNAHAGRTASIVSRRSIEDLALFMGDLSMGKGVAEPAKPAPAAPAPMEKTMPAESASTPSEPIDPLLVKKAMKAFRKRLKLTKLDEESSLGVGPMSGGRKSGIVAIQPPDSFPKEVWEELVRQNRLKAAGRGFYELGPQA